MTLLLFPAVVWVAACWGVAAHRHTIRLLDEAYYEALKPSVAEWARCKARLLDQQRRAHHTAETLTRLLAGWVR